MLVKVGGTYPGNVRLHLAAVGNVLSTPTPTPTTILAKYTDSKDSDSAALLVFVLVGVCNTYK